jgi:hypothetical protein
MAGNQSGSASEPKLHQSDMSKRMPNPSDASTRAGNTSVNSGATRDSVSQSHSIGGRVA